MDYSLPDAILHFLFYILIEMIVMFPRAKHVIYGEHGLLVSFGEHCSWSMHFCFFMAFSGFLKNKYLNLSKKLLFET